MTVDKILIDRAVLEQALNSLLHCNGLTDIAVRQKSEAIDTLRAALEQPQVEQEPIAWANINKQGDITHTSNKKMAWAKTPLYTHPQPPRRPPLPDEQPSSHACVACEDNPAPENSPCAVCGKTRQPQPDMGNPVSEPVAYFYTRSGRIVSTEATEALMQQMTGEPGRVALYAHPQPPRQPLTDEEIRDVAFDVDAAYGSVIEFARAIEHAHGIGGEA